MTMYEPKFDHGTIDECLNCGEITDLDSSGICEHCALIICEMQHAEDDL